LLAVKMLAPPRIDQLARQLGGRGPLFAQTPLNQDLEVNQRGAANDPDGDDYQRIG